MNNVNSSTNGSRRAVRRAVQIALASTMLASGVSHALLRDHGPVSTVDHFPLWYRENAADGGMAVGQCTFTDDAGNGPLCLTSTADAIPGRFAGNIGDEAFFATADIAINNGAFNILWLGHLEMAYLTADGSPPAVWSATDPQEVVFSRERIRVDTPTTPDGSCAGLYTIRTPFATHTFDLPEGGRALFYTDDKTAIPGDFQAALKGHTGPFLKWDVGADGLTPVSADNPAVTFTTPTGAVHKYIGDPNVPHLFVGSTLDAGPGHEDKGKQNYLEVTPPAGCDLGTGTAGQPVFEDLAAISGPIWDLAIQDPVTITKSVYTRDNTTAGIDVWANANKDQNLVLSASDSNSQHLPSVMMIQETVGGVTTGRYHAHLEIDPGQPIPSSVTVVNMTSNPQSRQSSAVVDAVVVTKNEYDPTSKTLCVAAHSGDETPPVGHTVNLISPNYGAFGPATGNCAGASGDLVLEKVLTDFNPDTRFLPEAVVVQTSLGGSETSQPISKRAGALDGILTGAVDDSFDNLQGSGSTTLDLTGAASGAAPGLVKTTDAADTVPSAAYRVVVISQPTYTVVDPDTGVTLVESAGTITAPATGGSVTYQAVEGMPSVETAFSYALQSTTDPTLVTNVAKVSLSVDKITPPPIAGTDTFGVFRTGGAKTLNILSNDVTGLSTTAIDPATVKLVRTSAAQTLAADGKSLTTVRGTVTVNANGSIVYTPVNQGGTANNTIESFGYTVANTAGSVSLPKPINIVLKTAAENGGLIRAQYRGSWRIQWNPSYATTTVTVPTTLTSADPAVTGGNTTINTIPVSGTCSLVTAPVGALIGTASYSAGNISVLAGSPAPGTTTGTVSCAQTNGNTFNFNFTN